MVKLKEKQLAGITILDKDGYGTVQASDSRIINLDTPIDGSDAATKDYVDSQSGGNVGDPVDVTSINIYVNAASGSDENDGTEDFPVQTFSEAYFRIRNRIDVTNNQAITIHLMPDPDLLADHIGTQYNIKDLSYENFSQSRVIIKGYGIIPAVDLTTSINLLDDIYNMFVGHFVEPGVHSNNDTSLVGASDFNPAIHIGNLNNVINAFNNHLSATDVHLINDTVNIVTPTASAGNHDIYVRQTITDLNTLKAAFLAHIADETFHVIADSTNVVTELDGEEAYLENIPIISSVTKKTQPGTNQIIGLGVEYTFSDVIFAPGALTGQIAYEDQDIYNPVIESNTEDTICTLRGYSGSATSITIGRSAISLYAESNGFWNQDSISFIGGKNGVPNSYGSSITLNHVDLIFTSGNQWHFTGAWNFEYVTIDRGGYQIHMSDGLLSLFQVGQRRPEISNTTYGNGRFFLSNCTGTFIGAIDWMELSKCGADSHKEGRGFTIAGRMAWLSLFSSHAGNDGVDFGGIGLANTIFDLFSNTESIGGQYTLSGHSRYVGTIISGIPTSELPPSGGCNFNIANNSTIIFESGSSFGQIQTIIGTDSSSVIQLLTSTITLENLEIGTVNGNQFTLTNLPVIYEPIAGAYIVFNDEERSVNNGTVDGYLIWTLSRPFNTTLEPSDIVTLKWPGPTSLPNGQEGSTILPDIRFINYSNQDYGDQYQKRTVEAYFTQNIPIGQTRTELGASFEAEFILEAPGGDNTGTFKVLLLPNRSHKIILRLSGIDESNVEYLREMLVLAKTNDNDITSQMITSTMHALDGDVDVLTTDVKLIASLDTQTNRELNIVVENEIPGVGQTIRVSVIKTSWETPLPPPSVLEAFGSMIFLYDFSRINTVAGTWSPRVGGSYFPTFTGLTTFESDWNGSGRTALNEGVVGDFDTPWSLTFPDYMAFVLVGEFPATFSGDKTAFSLGVVGGGNPNVTPFELNDDDIVGGSQSSLFTFLSNIATDYQGLPFSACIRFRSEDWYISIYSDGNHLTASGIDVINTSDLLESLSIGMQPDGTNVFGAPIALVGAYGYIFTTAEIDDISQAAANIYEIPTS